MKSLSPSRLGNFAAVVVASLALGCLSTLGAPVITQSSTEPDGDFVAGSNPLPYTSGTIQFNKGASQDRFGGVAFELTQASTVNSVTFYVSGVGSGAANAQATISFISLADVSAGSITYPFNTVYSETFTMPATISINQYMTFTFSVPATLQAGSYGVVFAWDAAGTQQSINFGSSATAGPGLNFRTTIDANGTVTTVGTAAERETLFLLDGTTVVPEPSTISFLTGASVLGFVWLRRRRQANA